LNLLQALLPASLAGFEQSGRQRAEDEPTDVGHISYPSALYLGQRANFAEELYQEPDAHEQDRRDESDLHEPTQNMMVRMQSRG
jgi:hypothetical protein